MKFESRSLGTILSGRIDVPNYQRDYSWDEENVLDYYNDITRFQEFSSPDEEYLVGQIIMHTEKIDGSLIYHVVDGQQRLCTTVILIKAIIDRITELINHVEGTQSEQLNNLRFLAIDSIAQVGKSEYLYRFSLSGAGQAFLKSYIYDGNRNISPGHSAVKKRLLKAYDILYEGVGESISRQEDVPSFLDRLLKTITKRLMVSYVETDDLSQAYIVFETLNARGCSLSYKDLIKNYFFAHCKDSDSVKNRWSDITTTLSGKMPGVDPESRYIRYYWNAKHPMARSRTLYREMSKEFDGNDAKIDSYLSELCGNAALFADIVTGNSNARITECCADSIRRIMDADASSFVPLVIALCLKTEISPKEIQSIVTTIESLVVRNCVIMKKTANKSEVLFARMAYEITSNKSTVKEIIQNLKSEIFPDESVRPVLESMEPSESQAKYLLKYIYDTDTSVMGVIKSSKKVQLEHIMPKDNSKWNVKEDVHSNYVGRLGNMTLLIGKDNAVIQNTVFEDKAKCYALSDYPDNPEIAKNNGWGVEEIESRQKELTDRILERWSSE